MLLVLDNFEYLIAPDTNREASPDGHFLDELNGVSLLLGLLQSAPQLKILVTSRTRLNVQGEQLYAIDGIDFPQDNSMTFAAVGQTSAVDLFVLSARRVQVSFSLTEENMGAVAHICRLVQGMPLAIQLAAGWIELLTPSEILAELNRSDHLYASLDFLITDQQNVPARHRSLRALFDHSWHLLNELEQQLFAQLSVFRGGFTLEAAQAVNGIVPLALMKLVNKSLVRRPVTGRYDLHELLCQYAAFRLAQTPALRDLVHAQHSAFYCHFLSKQEARLKGAEQQAALAQIELELENLRIAWHWAVEHEQIGQLAQAMPSLGLCYLWSSRYQEGEVTYNNTVRKLYIIKNQSPAVQLVLAQALAWQSVFTRQTKPLAESMDLLQQSMVILENLPQATDDTYLARAFILLQLGRQCEMQSEFAAAQQHYQQAIAFYRVLNDAWGQASVLIGLAEISRRSGELQTSLQLYEASLIFFRQLGDDLGSANVLTWLGFVLREQAKFVEAEE